MKVSPEKTGRQIAAMRKTAGLTQSELGDRLGVSYQAVSKWERGETLPDVGLLPDLAGVLRTTVDSLLTGGEKIMNYRGRVTVADMREGIGCLGRMGELLGRDNPIYRHAVDGINKGMNTDIEAAFVNDSIFECFVAEALIQNLISGSYVDITDVKNSFKSDKFRSIVCDYAAKYGIV
ncbi:MAG: helix-turn-helix transcriptional regulator [Oscillospiraceae bacterium]|nr:helix-turn-helix transcriptional regulator [Oscillospiraceae bacterium]